MPLLYKDHPDFFSREDITFIILTRDDIPSTVASFIAADKQKNWVRTGGAQSSKLKIRGIDKLRTRAVTRYILGSLNILESITPAIRISYEDLCQPNFNNPKLDHYFNREIKLDKPVQPISGADYIENWDWLKKTVEKLSNHYV